MGFISPTEVKLDKDAIITNTIFRSDRIAKKSKDENEKKKKKLYINSQINNHIKLAECILK